jgi:hypothetical protein
VSAIITDARVATIGTSVRIKRHKLDVWGLNPWRAWLNETNLLLDHNKILYYKKYNTLVVWCLTIVLRYLPFSIVPFETHRLVCPSQAS